MIIELSMCTADRDRLGGPEWIRLDTERVMDTPARDLIRWEAECGYPIERAMSDAADMAPPATATLILLWLARKQGGDLAGGIDEETGRPEAFRRLLEVRTMRVRIRRAQDVEPAPAESEGDAVPPGSSPAR